MTSQHGACNAAGRLRATALSQSGGAGVDGGPLKARGAQDKQGVWSWAKSLRISLTEGLKGTKGCPSHLSCISRQDLIARRRGGQSRRISLRRSFAHANQRHVITLSTRGFMHAFARARRHAVRSISTCVGRLAASCPPAHEGCRPTGP